VTVADASGHRASKQARLPILAANQAPVIGSVVVGRPDPTTGVVQGRIDVTDPDGDALTFRITSDTSSSAQRSITTSDLQPRSVQTANDSATTIVCPSSQGALGLNAASGSFTYTPTAPNPSTGVVTGEATDSFTVTVNDGYGGTTSVPVSVPTGSYGGGIQ
jgi:VCBS repeat-containing protein